MAIQRVSRIVVTGSAALALTLQAVPASASAGDTALGVFHHQLLGVSVFHEGGVGTIRVNGAYTGLTAGNSYFTVIYANGNCDPAQAFPVGPFTADRHGRATLRMVVPSAINVGGTMSMSVRMADTAADLDQDGKVGPTDVVAVAGSPSIGLIECNYHPTVLDRP